MLVALLLLGAIAFVQGLHRFGHKFKENNPYHPLEHNTHEQSDTSTWHGDDVHHDPAVFKKDYQYYNTWDESEIRPKRNEPLFVARTLQVQTKKWIKNKIHHGPWDPYHPHHWKAYCEGPTAARCQLFVCFATQDLVQHEKFKQHLKQKSVCPSKGSFPSLKVTDAEIAKSPLNKQFRVLEPRHLLNFVKLQYEKASRLCHETKHTHDERCLAETLCLTLEIFTETWPDIFKLEKCDATFFMKKDPRAVKLSDLSLSDYKDFPRLHDLNKDDPVPILPTDLDSISTRFKDHLRGFWEQRGLKERSHGHDDDDDDHHHHHHDGK